MNAFEEQAKIFKLLMHPARLAVLEILRAGEECVCHMEASLGLRQAYISQQLMVLREAGLVQDRRDGWNIFYRVIKPEIYPVLDAVNALVGENPGEGNLASFNKKGTECECPKCKAGSRVAP